LYVCDGAVHDNAIEVGETAVAVSVGVVVCCGVADVSLGVPIPTELIAETR
jgi:hypothetical protein